MRIAIIFFFLIAEALIVSKIYAFEKPVIHGFSEFAFGAKFKSDTTKRANFNLLEQRLQLSSTYYPNTPLLSGLNTVFRFKGDFFVDEYFGGKTNFELREANALISPVSWLDLKAGRQIFTWGTGDFLFINDLFPKDYIAFYIGREDQYLKKPSDGVKVSLYNKYANFDVVAIPFFEPNTIAQGDRLSFLDTFQSGISGTESERLLIEPPRRLNNTEIAVRSYRNLQSYEIAGYFFKGFYKMPRGYKNETLRQLFYPRLKVYGISLRGPALSGIANLEIGFYDSRKDKKGTDRLVENSMFKVMVGYEKDLGKDLRAGLQYLYEQILDYDRYRDALLAGDFFWDERRHLVTLRISKLLMSQTLELSLFTFYSPSDEDIYLRPNLEYDLTDQWKLTLGANLIWGRDDYTEFGQMERNSNIYTRLRYSF